MKKFLILIVIIFLVVPVSAKTINTDSIIFMEGNQYSESRDVIVKSIFDNEELDINKNEIKNEDDFVEYIGGVLKEVKHIISKDTITKDDKDVLKKTFVRIADFIFYDEEIKGMKFNDLSITSKKKILNYYKEMDKEIEKIYPNYKKTIKSVSKKKYNNLKSKADELFDKYRNEIKTESYELAKKESKSLFSRIHRKFNNWLKKVCD